VPRVLSFAWLSGKIFGSHRPFICFRAGFLRFVEELARFRSIFKTNVKGERPRLIFISGNHDVGIGSGIERTVFERFEDEFGRSSNIAITLANHTVVLLNTLPLAGAKVEEELAKDTWDFVESLAGTFEKHLCHALVCFGAH
jgi:hypothetical protein